MHFTALLVKRLLLICYKINGKWAFIW